MQQDGQRKENVRVAVILGYFNDLRYLNEQLNSIIGQTHKNLDIYIFDDCSDQPLTLEELQCNTDSNKQIYLTRRKKNLGFAKNFLMALDEVDDDYDFFAFSDQDDIWNPNKILAALDSLVGFDQNLPSLYCGRTNSFSNFIQEPARLSPLFKRPPHFANALVQNIGGGNTMVFNKAAKTLVATSAREATTCSHDWWCYLIISGAGGNVIFDPNPYVHYRQHGRNQVGSNISFRARVQRLKMLLGGRFRAWNSTNIEALEKNKRFLTPENIKILTIFKEARRSSFFKRLILYKKSGVFRQTLLGNAGIIFGLFLNKI